MASTRTEHKKYKGWYQTQGGGWYNPGSGQSVTDIDGFMQKNQLQTQMSDPSSYNTGIDYQRLVDESSQPQLSYEQMLAMSDPNAGERKKYANQLSALMADPDSIADTGVYKFAFDEGNKAIQRSAAARGMTYSGNTLAELTKYGQGMASQNFNNYADRLTGLAGLNRDNSNVLSQYLQQGSNRADLRLKAAGMKSNDYWNAQKMAGGFGAQTDYYRPMQW